MSNNSAKIFSNLIQVASYKDKPEGKLVSLTNITFFLGAGFSKSWDSKFPTGNELFSFDLSNYSDDLWELLQNIGYSGQFDFSKFKDLAYLLSMQKKYPAIRGRYIDSYNLELLENYLRSAITKRFKELANLNYINEPTDKLSLGNNLTDSQKDILKFFGWINDQTTGDMGLPEGIRQHFITTNYDFLIESILDEILGHDDSHLLYSYRGISPILTNGAKPQTTVFNDWLVQSIIKINGGFEIYADQNNFNIDYRSKSDEEIDSNAPILILPNREQDYTGQYFQSIFPKAVRLLQESKVLIIVGYSLPEEDALLRILLRQFAEQNVDCSEKFIFFINPMAENEQRDKIESVFPYQRYNKDLYHIYPYSGYFTDWVKSVLSYAGL